MNRSSNRPYCWNAAADGAPRAENNNNLRRARRRKLWNAVAIGASLIFAVANGEMMQGIANGTLNSNLPFDRPGFLSWSAYNYFLLSWVPLYYCCRNHLNCSIVHFMRSTWVGASSLKYMLAWPCIMQFLLLFLNTLWVIGLSHISVAVSNAIYQLQAVVTIGLSVCCVGNRFVTAEAIGMILSLTGVALIVLPPLITSEDGDHGDESETMIGMLATLMSAIIWAFYQISWSLISKGKRGLSRIEGLLDTLATLGVMGAVNLLVGWPILVVMHWTGIETFSLPQWDMTFVLTMNGVVEYAFDAACAVAIYLTSPIVTAVTAPLTIPISLVWDHYMHGSPLQVGAYDWTGALLILTGVVWMELKVPIPFRTAPCRPRKLTKSHHRDLQEMV